MGLRGPPGFSTSSLPVATVDLGTILRGLGFPLAWQGRVTSWHLASIGQPTRPPVFGQQVSLPCAAESPEFPGLRLLGNIDVAYLVDPAIQRPVPQIVGSIFTSASGMGGSISGTIFWEPASEQLLATRAASAGWGVAVQDAAAAAPQVIVSNPVPAATARPQPQLNVQPFTPPLALDPDQCHS